MHAWNGTWGVIATGFLAGKGLIQAAYGFESEENCNSDPTAPDACPFRQWGCWLGGDGHLLGAQIVYALWLIGMPMRTQMQLRQN